LGARRNTSHGDASRLVVHGEEDDAFANEHRQVAPRRVERALGQQQNEPDLVFGGLSPSWSAGDGRVESVPPVG
jgi:hypothetical protein